jgi:hypothetical protein
LVEGTAGTQDVLTVEVNVDGSVQRTEVSLTELSVDAWQHGYMDLDVQAGQQMTVGFQLNANTDAALVLDEISLGPSYSGVKDVYLPLVVRY